MRRICILGGGEGFKKDFRVNLKKMEKTKKVLMLIPNMVGGGAERIAARLMNEFYKSGFDVTFMVTSTLRKNLIDRDLDKNIPLVLLKEQNLNNTSLRYKFLRLFSSLLCRIFELFGSAVPAGIAYLSFVSQYSGEIKYLRDYLKDNPDSAVISFSQPANPLIMIASRGLGNRIVFSERADPVRLMKKRFGRKFIEKYYVRADAAVFQTEDAKNTYPENIAEKGTVIFNPVTPGLPQPCDGERSKNITTFCRISRQKNLPLLIDAFNIIHKKYPDYCLRIIGSPQNADDESVFEDIKKRISDLSLEKSVIFEPFSDNVHSLIIKDCMYVNSSDYEGMSNAMLEAMAIGLPCVCTDCPIGGANAVIKDGENGLLVKTGDADELARAVERVISDKKLSEKLSLNGRKIRDELEIENISRKWMELV